MASQSQSIKVLVNLTFVTNILPNLTIGIIFFDPSTLPSKFHDSRVTASLLSGNLSKMKARYGKLYWSMNAPGTAFAHDADFFKSSQISSIFFSALMQNNQTILLFG